MKRASVKCGEQYCELTQISSIESLSSARSLFLLSISQTETQSHRRADCPHAHTAQLVLPHISKGQLIQPFITGQHHSIIVVDKAPTLAFNYTSRAKCCSTEISTTTYFILHAICSPALIFCACACVSSWILSTLLVCASVISPEGL